MSTGTGNRTTQVLGVSALAGAILLMILGLAVTPPDVV
jgi:hypothetical protein